MRKSLETFLSQPGKAPLDWERLADDQERAEASLQDTQRELGHQVRQIMDMKAQEKEVIADRMAEVRIQADLGKTNRFQSERAQELLERQLNQQLLRAETLAEEVLAENPEVAQRTTEYNEQAITIYDLKGYPFSMLSHAVDYKNYRRHPDSLGAETARRVIEDPSIWAQTESEARAEYDRGSAAARGNVISASYTNSGPALHHRVRQNEDKTPLTCYGFSKLPADSIIRASKGDDMTPNFIGRAHTTVSAYDANIVDDLDQATPSTAYNEILLRRYDLHTGKPLLPDYIIAQDGNINDNMLRAAAYFNIPIVNIETAAYGTTR